MKPDRHALTAGPLAVPGAGWLSGERPKADAADSAIVSGVPGTCCHKKAFGDGGLVQVKGENAMRSFVTILAAAIAVAFTAPAFAGPGSTITNKEDCEKAGKVWDDAGKKCVEKQ
jgi:hypothetical protein